MKDCELLELAAKAAGLELHWDGNGRAFLCGELVMEWSPLKYDTDAFRLSAALRLSIVYMDDCVYVCREPFSVTDEYGLMKPHFTRDRVVQEYIGDDAMPAARRAITRAAAGAVMVGMRP